MNETSNICPRCRKELPVQGAAFCPFCGATLTAAPALEPEVKEWLDKAAQTNDPVKKHSILLEAQKAAPDCLSVERELLHLGRLYKRDPRHPSMDVIKCYLLQMYLTPDELSSEKKAAMRTELFEDEQLKRCQSLAPDAGVFTVEYLERLSDEFIQLFLEGSNLYMQRMFGFSFRKNKAKALAAPAANMLKNMQEDEGLTSAQREQLMMAFYRTFVRRVDDPSFLLAELSERNCTLPQ